MLRSRLCIPHWVAVGIAVLLVCAVTTTFSARAMAEESCPNESFRTGLSANLPDCRAYELVSPVFKEGATLNPPYLSSDGSHVIAFALGAFAGTESEANNALGGPVYEFSRTGSGWVASSLDPPASRFPNLLFLGPSSDLTKTLWELRESSQSVDDGDLYVRGSDARFVKIGPLMPPSRSSGPPGGASGEGLPFESGVVYAGASADLSHVLISYQPPDEESRSILWPGDNTLGTTRSLYEYANTGAVRPELVGVDEEGKLISRCGTELGGEKEAEKYNAISSSGERVLFTALHATGEGVQCSPSSVDHGPEVNELYDRVGGVDTVPISEPSHSQCNRCLHTGEGEKSSAEFQGASEDGSKVFFTTEQELLEGQATKNLYEFDFEAPFGQRIVLVSKGSSAPEVQGVARVSEDGSHVYFVARGILTTGANREGRSPTPGADNLYVFERNASDPSGHLTFIVTLSEGDDRDWSENDQRPVQATPNGRFLVFASASRIFKYDTEAETLVSVSLAHTAQITEPVYTLTSSPTIAQSGAGISNDGSDVVFTSTEAVTPGAEVAADAGARSVYEYHSDGAGANGSVSLISDGKDISGGIALYGMDASGGDVLFQTGDPLVAADTNTEIDLYDARVDGGFPEPVMPVACAGEACQGPQSPSSPFSPPGSLSVAGGGNLAPAAPPMHAATGSKPTPPPRALTRAQKLAKALEACAKDKPKKKRAECRAKARKQYGHSSRAGKSSDGRVR